MKAERIDVSETDLETILINDLDEISEGMKFLGRQIDTDTGTLDILAVDSDGMLTILELKIKQDDEQLFQGVRYYDWIKSRIEWIRRSYEKEYDYIIDVSKDPWLILVAPSFSENLMKVTRYIDLSVNLFTYAVLQIGDSQKIICNDIDYGEPYEVVSPPTLVGHVNWISDNNIQKLLRTSIERFKELKMEVRPKRRRISLFYHGKRISRIKCNKKSLNIKNYYGPDYSKSITTENELNDYLENYLIPYLESGVSRATL